jgi:hypothetical protein
MSEQIDLFTKNVESGIKSLNDGLVLDEVRERLIKGFIQDQTGFSFDDSDQEWGRFVIRYSYILNEVRPYNRFIINILSLFFLFYGIVVYIFSLFYSSDSAKAILSSILSKNSFITLFFHSVPYFLVYSLLIIYIIPYAITYYSIRKEMNLIHILFKNFKYTKWMNIFVFVMFVFMVSYSWFYIPLIYDLFCK